MSKQLVKVKMGERGMFFAEEKCDWTVFDKHELELAEDAFELFEDDISSKRKPQGFFIKGILLTNFIGYEDASDDLKDAITDEILYQWDLAHPDNVKSEQ